MKAVSTMRIPGMLAIMMGLGMAMAIRGGAAQEAPGAVRQQLNFNREWRFGLGDHPGAEAAAFDDSMWSAVGLPHSFSLPYFLSDKFYIGYGWYRKAFEAPADWRNRRVFIEFEGAFQDTEIFVNGKAVGRHQGGYTGFSFDITDQIRIGTNLLAVRVNNRWNPRLAPRAGEHVFSGGIYRDVHLVVTSPLHVTWFGTFVTTQQVSEQFATMNVKTEIRNDAEEARSFRLATAIRDPDGKVIVSLTSTQTIAPGATLTLDQASGAIATPKLWHPDHPFLYHVVSRVYEGETPVDDFETPFGFRWFEWTADRGFFLNGKHFYVRGANVHQDHAGWGDAVANSGFERDVRLMKEAGFDFIRGSHYPHDPAFSEACDRLGMLFWSENCFWGIGGFKPDGGWDASAYPPNPADGPEFEASVKASLRDMIRVHRNHPSIIAWSMDNEVFFTENSTLPRVREFLRELVQLSHELDPTRPAAIGGCQRGEIDKLGDIAGYNGDGARLFLNPGIPSVVSEYGSTVAARPGKYEPGWGDLQPEKFPWRSGEAIWCGFDHGSIAGTMGQMGIVDYFRLPKRMFFWYRNEYRKVPPPDWPRGGTPDALRLSADKTTIQSTDGTDDAQLIVTVVDANGNALSNSPPVTLSLAAGPGEFPTGTAITFDPKSDIAIRDGQAAIEFRSYHAGESVIRATSPGLREATITIRSLGEPKFIAGQTPPVQPRPYLRLEMPTVAASSTEKRVNVAAQRPTRASTESPQHTARLANDEIETTFWEPRRTDTNVWWQVDLESVCRLERVRTTFPAQGNFRYRIEVSKDAQQWTLAADQTQTGSTDQKRTDQLASGVSGRFLRLTFAHLPAACPGALAEVEVQGQPGKVSLGQSTTEELKR
jgi:hypothetical protein